VLICFALPQGLRCRQLVRARVGVDALNSTRRRRNLRSPGSDLFLVHVREPLITELACREPLCWQRAVVLAEGRCACARGYSVVALDERVANRNHQLISASKKLQAILQPNKWMHRPI
jgi:hypothetical protein